MGTILQSGSRVILLVSQLYPISKVKQMKEEEKKQ